MRGENSFANLDDILFDENKFPGSTRAPYVVWDGSRASDGSAVTVSDSMFSDNSKVRFENQDPSYECAVIFASHEGLITSKNVMLARTEKFQSIFFAQMNSNMTVNKSCIQYGEAQVAVYSDESSYISAHEDYVVSFHTSICRTSGVRLSHENTGSHCFEPGGDCGFTCDSFDNSDFCRSGVQLTKAPSSAPTVQPGHTNTNTSTQVSNAAVASTMFALLLLVPTVILDA